MKYKDEITSWLKIVTINDDNTGVLYHKRQLNIPHGNVIYWMTILNLNTEYSLEPLLKLCTKHASVFLLTVHCTDLYEQGCTWFNCQPEDEKTVHMKIYTVLMGRVL